MTTTPSLLGRRSDRTVSRNCKVYIISSTHPPFDFRMFHWEGKSLVRAGYEVTIVVPYDGNEIVDGIRIEGVTKPRGRVERMTRTAWALYRHALKRDADVYHLHDPELLWIGALLRLRGRKVIMDIREDFPRMLADSYYLPAWARKAAAWILERLENRVARSYSAILCAWPEITRRFEKLNSRTVTIHNFPSYRDLGEDELLPLTDRPNWLVYIGSIGITRGSKEMVESLDLLGPDHPSLELKLAGTFYPAALLEETLQLPGWKRVHFLNYLSRRDMLELLKQSRIGLLALHETPNHLFSWPVKLFEYMLAGIPIIVSDIPLWRRIVEEAGCGLVIPSKNSKALARAVDYLLTHPEEAQAMGERGRSAVRERYNWETQEEELLRIYDLVTMQTDVRRQQLRA